MRNHLSSQTIEDQMTSPGRNQSVVEWLEDVTPKGGTVIDAGCGYGWVAWHLRKLDSSSRVICIEPDAKTLEIAREVNSGANVLFYRDWAESDMELVAVADVAVSIEVLEHVPRGSEVEYLQRIAQSLKVGGRALVTTPAWTCRSALLDPAYWLTRHRHYSKSSLTKIMRKAGLNITAIERRGGWGELISTWDLYISKWVFRRRPIFSRFYRQTLSNEWNGTQSGWMGWWIELERPN